MAIAFGLGTFRLEGTRLTISRLAMAGLDRVAIIRLLMPGITVGQALPSRAGEGIGVFVVAKFERNSAFAYEPGVSALVSFTVEGVVFQIASLFSSIYT